MFRVLDMLGQVLLLAATIAIQPGFSVTVNENDPLHHHHHHHHHHQSSSNEGDSNLRPPCHSPRRALPPKVIVGYANECNDDVMTAVRQGVNVVIWAFYHLSPTGGSSSGSSGAHYNLKNQHPPESHDEWFQVDLECIANMIQTLDNKGYSDTVHLLSMGGWNGPHLDPYFQTADEWFTAWKAMVGHVFHGLDVDFEGNDNMTSPLNYFSVDELDRVGHILQLAKDDGYLVTIAPAQSYLDIHSSHFGRFLNVTDPSPQRSHWHGDFSYFGQNAYAYWLAKYGEAIDLVMIQFYESWSRASMEINQNYMTPENYLQQYVWDLNSGGGSSSSDGIVVAAAAGDKKKPQTFEVDFAMDPAVGLPCQNVPLPLSKLVWGFANGWAKKKTNTAKSETKESASSRRRSNGDDDDSKHVYFPIASVQAAYGNLWDWMLEPRGMMFWVISSEGTNGIYYAQGLNQILHIRDDEVVVQASES